MNTLIRIYRCILVALLPVLAGCGSASVFEGFRTSDGLTIAADLRLPPSRPEGAPSEAPLVILAHQLGRDRTSWEPLVPYLLESGYAVMTLDLRGFGESTKEAASPAELTDAQKNSLYLDVVESIPAVSGQPGIDASRIAVVGAGFSVTPAARCALEYDSVKALVLLSGALQATEEEFLIQNSEFPVLLVISENDDRGRDVMGRHMSRMTGENQLLFRIPPVDSEDPADWEGTDGLRVETGLADLIAWFLEENF